MAPCLAAPAAQAARSSAPSDIDGVPVVGTEPYPSQARSEVLLGTGIYPMNSYFNSFSIDLAYDYRITRSLSWEVLRADDLYSVNKDLAQTLADRFLLAPPTIERPSYMISTDLIYVASFGKFVAADEGIRYFKTELELGGGVMGTNIEGAAAGEPTGRTLPTANLGIRFDIYISRVFSGKIEVRDTMAVTAGFENFIMFTLGGGLSL